VTSQDDEGLCTAHAIAIRIGVKVSTVLHWARSGILEPVRRGGPGRSHRFRLDDATLAATLARLDAEKKKMEARRAAASGAEAPAAST